MIEEISRILAKYDIEDDDLAFEIESAVMAWLRVEARQVRVRKAKE